MSMSMALAIHPSISRDLESTFVNNAQAKLARIEASFVL